MGNIRRQKAEWHQDHWTDQIHGFVMAQPQILVDMFSNDGKRNVIHEIVASHYPAEPSSRQLKIV